MPERGAHVIVHGRNRERGREIVEEIQAGPGSASFYAADFVSPDQVRALGEASLRDYPRIDVLVNNAGIWLPMIPRSPDSRIVNVSSGAQRPIDLDDPMLERSYSGGRRYAQSSRNWRAFAAIR